MNRVVGPSVFLVHLHCRGFYIFFFRNHKNANSFEFLELTFFLSDVFLSAFLFLFAYSVLCFCLVASFCFLVLLVLLARAKSICKNKKNKEFKTALITSFNYYLAPFESIGASTFSYLIEEWGYKLLIFFCDIYQLKSVRVNSPQKKVFVKYLWLILLKSSFSFSFQTEKLKFSRSISFIATVRTSPRIPLCQKTGVCKIKKRYWETSSTPKNNHGWIEKK